MNGVPEDVIAALLEYQAENANKIANFEKETRQALFEIANLKNQNAEKDKFQSLLMI